MKLRLYIATVVICFAIGGLTFTSLFFYDYNTRIVMVEEVQEEQGEDLASLESNSENLQLCNWADLISQASDVRFNTEISLSQLALLKTSGGYFLDLIKPPIQ